MSGMLASLLPGLREIRAPLVSGYLWLVFFFLALNEWLPNGDDQRSPLHPAFELGDQLSTFGLAAVSGVAAYLVGSAVQELLKLGGRLVSPRRPLYGEPGSHLSRAGFRDIRSFVNLGVQRVQRRLFQLALAPGEKGIDEEPTPWMVENELSLVRMLLLGERPELVREIDRLQAEADLRITVAFPLACLAAFLALETSTGWLALIPLAVLLVIQGHQRQREAGDLLAKALRIGKANAPALESLEASADAALERSELEEELDRKGEARHPMAEFRLGCLKATGEEFDTAIACFRFAAENGVIRAHAELGAVHERCEEFELAERAYRDGGERGDRKARRLLSELLSRLARDEEALEAADGTGDDDAGEGFALPLEALRDRSRIANYRRRMEAGDAKAAINLGLLLDRRKDLDGAYDALVRATEIDPKDSQAWLALGAVASNLGRLEESEGAYERALGLLEAQLGPRHLRVAIARGNQSANLLSLGKYARAQEQLEEVLSIMEAEGSDRLEVAIMLGNLASAVLVRGQMERGVELLERALEIKREHGADRLSIALTTGHLGNALIATGDVERALDLLEDSLAVKREELGRDHFDVAVALGNVAGALQYLGHYQRARVLCEEALAIKEKLNVSEISVAMSQTGLADALRSLGEYGRARKLQETALAVKERAGESQELSVANTRCDLGVTLHALGQTQRAQELLEAALAEKERQLNPEHPYVIGFLSALGDLLVDLDQPEKAHELSKRAVSIAEGQFGRDHFIVACALGSLGEALRRLGSPNEAEEVLGRACAIAEPLDQKSPLPFATILRAHGRALWAGGRPMEARARLEEARNVQVEAVGPGHLELVATLEALAETLDDLGESGYATSAREQAATIRRKYGID